ncbi:colicin immunity protein Cui [Serratia sp. AXJ-M]|uniref:colicin immunity protein Cui n=1 Tax=Serratia sp. AXJ-M TaxID=2754727 RepID=UPI0039795D2D
MFIGVIPLIIIFGVYLHNPESQLLNNIATRTGSLPAVLSSNNQLMTKVMDVYCKSAPLLALLLFSLSIKKRRLIKITNRGILIRSCLLSPFVYLFFIYMFLFRSLELTTAGRPVRLMSSHDITLLLFYIFLYLSIFLLTYGILYIPVIAYKLFKERR